MAESVKIAITRCCLQLKSKLTARRLERDHAARAKNLAKYVPDCSRALFGVIAAMKEAHESEDYQNRKLSENEENSMLNMIKRMKSGEVTEEAINSKLIQAIANADHAMALEQAAKRGRGRAEKCEIHLIPEQIQNKNESNGFCLFNTVIALNLFKSCNIK